MHDDAPRHIQADPGGRGQLVSHSSARVTKPQLEVVLVPMILTTAFACRYKNKLCLNDLRMCHQWLALPLEHSDF
jgi:hypothetical protein